MIDSIQYYLTKLLENGKFKILLTLVITPLINHITSLENTVQALLFLLTIDWFLGLTIAFLKRNISSKSSFAGLFKFILYFFTYYSMVYLDKILEWEQSHFSFTRLITIYLGLTEGISILENIAILSKILNIRNPVPVALLEKLKIAREDVFDTKQKTQNSKRDYPREEGNRKSDRLENDQKTI